MEKFEYEEMARTQETHWWFVARREILEALIRKFSPTKTQKNILEIGAGTGANLEMLSTLGKVTAVEPNEVARKNISEKFSEKITLINGKIPGELNLQNQKFDVICLFDVLEHIEDDKAALREIKKILERDGRIILTVPAFQFMWSNHDKNLHHFRRYSKKDLCNLIKSCGLEVVEISYFNFFLFPIAFLARILTKKSTAKKPNYFLNKLFREVFLCEKSFLEKGFVFPFGLSLFAILENR